MTQETKFKKTEIGMIPEDWEVSNLEKVVDILTGFPFKGDKYSNEGIKVLRGENVSIGFIRWDTEKRWNHSLENLDKYYLQDLDIVIGMDGSRVGQNRAIIKKSNLPLLLAQRVTRLRAKDKLNQKYLYYIIFSDKFFNHVESVRTGTSIPHISSKQIGELMLAVPPISEQRAIAHILSTLDSQIELLQQQNQTLEAIGKAIFKSWFVDFEFPNEEGKPYKSGGGKMAYNEELGKEIPGGWGVKTIEKCSDNVIRGFTTKYVEKSNLINLNQKVNRGKYLDKSNFKYYPDNSEVPEEKYARKQDLLVNSLGQGTLGRMHLYWEDASNVVVDQHITIIRTNKEILKPSFLYLYLTTRENQSRLESEITGSTGMLMLNVSKIRDFEIILPDKSIQESFNKCIVELFEKKSNNVLIIESLSKIRDSLLPKLMSGKIRVNTSG